MMDKDRQTATAVSAAAGRRVALSETHAPMFSEIAAVSLKDKVIAALKNAFFGGELRPGDAIIERELARQMAVGTPVVREALICLEGQGYVRRVINTGTFVTNFSAEEVRQLHTLRVELETLALQWARPRVTEADIKELKGLLDCLIAAGESGNRRGFLEGDLAFHRRCWQLSGNVYLCDTLEKLMAPLFAFDVLEESIPTTETMAREHCDLLIALQNLQEPEFSFTVRKALTGFAFRWISAISMCQKR
jgi:DNA-binding GntR family transcriptional regulator